MKKTFFIFLFIHLLGFNKPPQETNISPTAIGEVASAHPLATQAGLAILKQGGNAFDAAIAVASTLNVVEPGMSGLGGYGTILIYSKDENRIRYLNSSGRFPVATNSDLMREPTPNFMSNRVGPKSISTPGNLNAWKAMHSEYGRLPWGSLFEAAIMNAEKGFVVSSSLAFGISRSFEDFSPYTRSFYGSNDAPLKEGDTLIQKDLANTFRIIQSEGVNSFYRGAIAKQIDEQMQQVGSFLALEDLQNNQAEWWDPLKMEYRNYEVYTAGLPSNAFAAFVNLGIMRELDPKSLKHNSTRYLHFLAEMTKESYKARLAYSFDPEIKEAPLDSLLSKEILNELASNLSDSASTFIPPYSPESKNTTHFVVIDRWGNIVSATQTLGNVFGSGIMVEGIGIWMNNSMAYSTFEPKGNPMDAFPGRHKLSGDCPVIIMKDGKPWAALGSPGGHTITQNVPQIIFNLIDFEMDMQTAIEAPKIAFVEPDIISGDPWHEKSVRDSLTLLGHKLMPRRIGNAHGIKLLYDSTGQISGYDVGVDRRVNDW
ncbi:gamma-glutamyltransferase [Algoriphagus pacificus]|uniref:Glutathione hydrolase proenzyme n=1 Tax=Algoriphagus pacificus TaxID=2811234 RepID=A0ABS3CBV8_9BACT|nr:gamma-glutamyltransferase [Algoriphagus pacificus]MBN7814594.1 gamma-glutamyltransferase [Algoriphagus pacificus]